MPISSLVVRCIGLCAAWTLTSAQVPAPNAAALDFTIIMSGRVKGELTVRREAAGRRTVHWTFDDRGRGPDLTEVRDIGPDGLPTAISVDGKDYRKAVIAERFTMTRGAARWQSDADTGESSGRGFYLPSQSNHEDLAALARALLANGGALDILPSGRVGIERITERSIASGGKPLKATLYFISGLDMQPVGIWLDSDGELVAGGGAFLGTVRKAYEADQAMLLATAETIARERLAVAAQAAQRRPAGPVAFRHAAVYDAVSRQVRKDMTVLVEGDRIKAVGPDAKIIVPPGAEQIDVGGRTLLPGMWDMHVHLLDPGDGLLDLFAGVTTVRDLANDAERTERITRLYDSGGLPGPHVLRALLIDGKGPLTAPLGVTADTPQEIERLIGDAAKQGYVQIKLYSSLRPELVKPAVRAAHANGLRISGHVPATMSMRDVVQAGFDEVQHAYFWLLNFMSPEIQARTNSPSRFSDAGLYGLDVRLDDPKVRDFVKFVGRRGVVLDPTFVAFETMFVAEKGKLSPYARAWSEQLPARELRGTMTGGRGVTPDLKRRYDGSYARARQLLLAFHRAGAKIVPGTDGSALLYVRELENYAEAGIANRDILYFATLGSARTMKRDGTTGSIAPGKIADLVIVDGDPLARIGDLRRTWMVMKSGTLFDPQMLGAAAGLRPRK